MSAGPRLLAVLDRRVRALAKTPSPDIKGTICVAVRDGTALHCWSARFSKDSPLECAFSSLLPDEVDAVLLLGALEARSILESGKLPPKTELLKTAGDRNLLERFIERYCTFSSWVGARAKGKKR